MPNYKSYDYSQSAMVVINFEDQLQPGTFEHAIHYLIDQRLDLSIFDLHYKNDSGGRAAYDPAILLKIVLFAYAKGITSTREIQWCCQYNIIFKALSCDTVPHFTTIASFVSSYPEAIEDLFEQVLLVCHQQGLLGNELFAIDGCKMSSNAAKEWSGTLEELTQKRDKIRRQIKHCLKEHQRLDKRGNESKDRADRLAQTVETLDKAHEKIERFLKTATPRMGKAKRPKEVKSNITDNESAKMTTSKGTIQGYNGVAAVDKKHQVVVEAQAFGEGQEHHTLEPILRGLKERYQRTGIAEDLYKTKAIITADTGFSNEDNNQYLRQAKINAYIPDNQFRSRDPKFQDQKEKYGKRHQDKPKVRDVIPATEFTFDEKAKTCFCPQGNAMWLSHEGTDQNGALRIAFEGRLTDCRHCPIKSHCMRNPGSADTRKGHGRMVSFLIKARRHRTATDWMKRRVDSKKGKQIYSHRMSVVEPVFGNIGTNKGLNRFSLRGKAKVQGQWQLFCLIQNVEKLMRYGNLACNRA